MKPAPRPAPVRSHPVLVAAVRPARPAAWGALAALALLAACSNDSPADNALPDAGEVDAATDAASDATPTDDASEDAGLDPTPDPTCPGSWLVTWSGQVVDDAGAPVAGALAQMCLRSAISDELVCLRPSESDDEGRFEVVVPPSERCVSEAAARIFSTDLGLAEIYCPVDLAGGSVFAEDELPAVLYRTSPATDLPPLEGTRTPRTVDFGDGLTIRIVPEILDIFIDDLPEAYETLGSARVIDPAAQRALCFIAPGEEMDGLAVFTPNVDVFGRPFEGTFPNTAEHPPGTRMDIFLLGGLTTTLDAGQSVKEGEWRYVATGVVSEDGATIAAPSGIHALTWYGWRAEEAR